MDYDVSCRRRSKQVVINQLFAPGLKMCHNPSDFGLSLSVPNFRQHLSFAFFFIFNKQSLGKKLICKVERLYVKKRRTK